MTGAHDGRPAGADREAVSSGGTRWWGRFGFWLVAAGLVVVFLTSYQIASGHWLRPVLGTLTPVGPVPAAAGLPADSLQLPVADPGTPVLSASVPAVSQALVADPAYPRLVAAVKDDLTEAPLKPQRAERVLPPIWHEGMRFTWFSEIGELGRVTYVAMPDPDGLPFENGGFFSGSLLASLVD